MSENPAPPLMPSGEPHTLDERKFALEVRKFELELERFHREKTASPLRDLLNKNLGVVITAMIGVATVVVSALQLEISRNSNEAQLKLSRETSTAQLELEKSKANAQRDQEDRKFQFAVASLLLEKQNEIITEDVTHIYYLRDVVMTALPTDISLRITRKMADNASDDIRRSAWNDGYVKIKLNEAPQPPVVASSTNTAAPTITVDVVLSKFDFSGVSDARTRIGDVLQQAAQYHLNDDHSLSVLLAFILRETGNFRYLSENLSMSASRIASVWPSRFKNASDAAPFANDPEALSNKIYAGRLGNSDPGDGWKYRGRGYLGTTGKESYRKSGALIGVDLVENPDRLLESKLAAQEAFATFAQLEKPMTVEGVVRRMNGGFFGLAEVQANYEKLAAGAPKVTEGLKNVAEPQGSYSQPGSNVQ
jgi:predicted chitinase